MNTWDNMTPRQRNLLVAEHAAGWRWVKGQHYDVCSVKGEQIWLLPPEWSIRDITPGEWTFYNDDDDKRDNRLTWVHVPHYTEDIGAAFSLLEHAGITNWKLLCQDGMKEGYHYLFVTNPGDYAGYEAYGATPAEAICKVLMTTKEMHS